MLERINYRGWQNSYRIFNGYGRTCGFGRCGSSDHLLRLRDGENVLHEVPEHAGLSGGREFRLYGGHRLWIWPELASTYFPDNFPVAVSEDGNSVAFYGAVGERSSWKCDLQKQLEFNWKTEVRE